MYSENYYILYSVQLMVTNQALYTIMYYAETNGRRTRKERAAHHNTIINLGKYVKYKCIYQKNACRYLLWMVHQPTLIWHILIVRQQWRN